MNPGVEEDTRLPEDLVDDIDEISPPESKRIRLDDGSNNNLNSTLNSATKNNTRWTCAGDTSLVEPEILEDMGVSMLEDEEMSGGSVKKLKTHECTISPTGSQNRRTQSTENGDIVYGSHSTMYRDSSFETVHLERSERSQDPFELEDASVYLSIGNESGYSSRVETETFGDMKQSFSKDELGDMVDKNGLDQFYLYRRKKRPSITGEDKFNKLSDEMILMILRWLPKKCLVRSMLVCKRWCQIARDEALWSRLDLGGKVLGEGTLGHILPRGVQTLRLAQAEIADPVFQPSSETLNENYVSKLQYLDLSMSVISPDGLAALLSVCKFLKKLSLEKCTLNRLCCTAISKNQDLEVLNLTMCEGIDIKCLQDVLKLSRLNALNVAWCGLDLECMTLLCRQLPSTITRLNIAGCRKTMTDDNVKELVKCCPRIIELDMSDCTMLTINATQSLLSLTKLEHLALSRCYSIPPTTYLRLAHMPCLMYLDVFGLMAEPTLDTLQASCGNTEINKFLYSSVARPTVGVRRTSIWGLRVRD
ncbi:S-phase kinase-associated protein 2 isoform X1 [Neodiprion pinetum]|uniref:S-phase kinase-associated protein 2 isoform X1 n=1 Tax=Neodiprion lecontei TaxID=441921 RepID=A0A6J0C420_NEOLC|nr:S-phase kinase-associated protein 2 isoform X1 [Neodiprion lecontei]XP_046423957.1 S-phase kinase-associated protein 2 isoform X1 [Neodiprion fabricii]XP_046479887.1 S-phase kinase-associated protein 2 isoform X1 [Neodiprion pinetum]